MYNPKLGVNYHHQLKLCEQFHLHCIHKVRIRETVTNVKVLKRALEYKDWGHASKYATTLGRTYLQDERPMSSQDCIV